MQQRDQIAGFGDVHEEHMHCRLFDTTRDLYCFGILDCCIRRINRGKSRNGNPYISARKHVEMTRPALPYGLTALLF